MTSPVPQLAPRLAEVLRIFRESDVQPTNEEIVWLADLRRACDIPHDGSVPWLMGAPLSFSGVKWWPLHRLAESWFVRSMKLLEGDESMQTAVYLYAHAVSGPGDRSLQGLTSEADIRTVLQDWYDSLPVHDNAEQLEALCDALRRLDGDADIVPDPDRETVREDPQDDLPAFVTTICQAFPGVPPSYWLTELPAHEVRAMIAKVSVGSDDWATSPKRTAAIENWLKAVKWVWKNHE